jgi:hypothetical protein
VKSRMFWCWSAGARRILRKASKTTLLLLALLVYLFNQHLSALSESSSYDLHGTLPWGVEQVLNQAPRSEINGYGTLQVLNQPRRSEINDNWQTVASVPPPRLMAQGREAPAAAGPSFNLTLAKENLECADRCTKTCFTRRALDDLAYPFSSLEEKQWFASADKKGKRKGKKGKRKNLASLCKSYMDKSPSAPRWCPLSETNSSSSASSSPMDASLERIPTGCSKINGMGAWSGPFDRMILFPQGKLAFCGIPKVGITQWVQFLRYIWVQNAKASNARVGSAPLGASIHIGDPNFTPVGCRSFCHTLTLWAA